MLLTTTNHYSPLLGGSSLRGLVQPSSEVTLLRPWEKTRLPIYCPVGWSTRDVNIAAQWMVIPKICSNNHSNMDRDHHDDDDDDDYDYYWFWPIPKFQHWNVYHGLTICVIMCNAWIESLICMCIQPWCDMHMFYIYTYCSILYYIWCTQLSLRPRSVTAHTAYTGCIECTECKVEIYSCLIEPNLIQEKSNVFVLLSIYRSICVSIDYPSSFLSIFSLYLQRVCLSSLLKYVFLSSLLLLQFPICTPFFFHLTVCLTHLFIYLSVVPSVFPAVCLFHVFSFHRSIPMFSQ